MNSFCTKCGARLIETGKFCQACGAPRATPTPFPAAEGMPSLANGIPGGAGNAPTVVPAGANSGRRLVRVAALVLGLLALVGLLGLGGCVYMAFRIKNTSMQEARSLTREAQDLVNDPAVSTHDDTKELGETQPALESNAAHCPVAGIAGASDQSAIVPLQPGLTIVDAWHTADGDYELIENIDSIAPDSVRLFLSDGKNHNEAYRTVCREDLQQAHTYKTGFSTGDPEVFPGSTLFSVSAKVLNDLKSKGRADFTYAQIVDEGDEKAGITASRRFVHEGFTWDEWSGEILRVEEGDVQVPVIVNDQRVQLPAVHAKGMLGKELTDLWVVDDPLDPVTLRFAQPSSKFSLQVVKLSFAGEAQIEESLKKKGTAEIHGIYFDFGSDEIRSESEPVLKEIADTMTTNPAWNLHIEGHTDNIGGDQYNQALSERRAAAVKVALVERFHITDSRLSTAGFGASRPKESNDTLEGRARNRRVELVRQ